MTAITCAHCGDDFTHSATKGPKPKYCSGRCRQAAHRARHDGVIPARSRRHQILGERIDFIWRCPTSKPVRAFIESLYRETGVGFP